MYRCVCTFRCRRQLRHAPSQHILSSSTPRSTRPERSPKGPLTGIRSCKKKCSNPTIFLDTEFSENYTFVSCNFPLWHRSSIDRENRQNGNQESSQEGRKEDRKEEEVIQPKGKAERGTHPASPVLRLPAIQIGRELNQRKSTLATRVLCATAPWPRLRSSASTGTPTPCSCRSS